MTYVTAMWLGKPKLSATVKHNNTSQIADEVSLAFMIFECFLIQDF